LPELILSTVMPRLVGGEHHIAALAGLDNKAECYINLSERHMALARFDVANDLIEKALKPVNLTDQDRLSLMYQSGLVYKEKGDSQKAQKVFQKVYDADRNFRLVDTVVNKHPHSGWLDFALKGRKQETRSV